MNSINIIKEICRRLKRASIHALSLPLNYIYLESIQKRIRCKYKNEEMINVLFIMQFPEMWNSEKSVYMAFKNDKRFNVNVLAIPKVYRNKKRIKISSLNEAAIFCKKNNMIFIDGYTNGNWVDYKSLKPDFIFIQRPYDGNMPCHMFMKKLKKTSMLCYIPYGYEFVNNVHLEIEYNPSFLNSVFCCFAENIDTYNYINKASTVDVKLGLRKVFNIGYPRFDFISMIESDTSKRKTILWTPRWSVNDYNDKTGFFDYFGVLMDFMEKNIHMSLIIRPHPLMFRNFIETGIITKSDARSIKKRVNNTKNVEWDNSKDYLRAFEKSDMLISDFSSLVIEYYATNKPVLYCGRLDGFNSVGEKMATGMYHIHSAEELLKTIDYLSRNSNIYFKHNRNIIEKHIKKKNRIGIGIKNQIVDTYCLD